MLTINLEKELLKENKRIPVPAELLQIKEYEKFADLADDNTLHRLGLNENLVKGRSAKVELEMKNDAIKKYNQERVFHISQIENLCLKYCLRFLPTNYFKGTVDSELPNKINNFEIAYGNRCSKTNTYIVAPAGSFKLEERPKDPLMFYRIDEENFYLIHKWGNDLSIYRRFLGMLSNTILTVLTPFMIGLGLILGFIITYNTDGFGYGVLLFILGFMIWFVLFGLIVTVIGENFSVFNNSENWNKPFKK